MIIDEGNVLTLLAETVETYGGPDTTYPDRVHKLYSDPAKADIVRTDCYYFTPGDPVVLSGAEDDFDVDWQPMEPQPLCLIGCLFIKLGFEAKIVEQAIGNSEAIGHADIGALERIGLQITPKAMAVLTEAQSVQDSNRSWGASLDAARFKLEAFDVAP